MNNCVTVVVGCKWGDEGKGKIASLTSKNAKFVIRATGGSNAGHTVIYNGKKWHYTSFLVELLIQTRSVSSVLEQ